MSPIHHVKLGPVRVEPIFKYIYTPNIKKLYFFNIRLILTS